MKKRNYLTVTEKKAICNMIHRLDKIAERVEGDDMSAETTIYSCLLNAIGSLDQIFELQ